MTDDTRKQTYEQTLAMLRPALERVASDPRYREHLERDPLSALAELGVELDQPTRAEMEGKRFSEFWAARRARVEGPIEVRDLPPNAEELAEEELATTVGGITAYMLTGFAPPYVPVAPAPPPDGLAGPSIGGTGLLPGGWPSL